MKKQLHPFLLLLLLFSAAGIRAQTEIHPPSFTFPPQQTLTESDAHPFMIKNVGDTPVVIHPENVVLEGKHSQTTRFSVLSYNIEADDGNWPGRFAFMLEEIRAMDVDIMGLQEVIQREHLDNQAMQMADSLGFYYYFDSVDDEHQAFRYGNAIVSRYPIEETNFRVLQPLTHHRNAIHALVNVNGHSVDMYNTHLHHPGLDHHIREEQIADLLDFIEETNSGGFIFVTGDFNANPDWEEMQQMYATLKDVYPLFHDNHLDPEHATLNHRLGHQMRRIDYVFFNKASLDRLVPLSAEIVMDQEHEDPDMENDHFGVFATFDLLADDVDFMLCFSEESVELQPQDSVTANVSFTPQTVGMKEVVLSVHGHEATISGEAFDATISDFPWDEDFDTTQEGALPFGWSANTENWGVENTSLAGGEAPELVFAGDPAMEGTFFAMSPPLKTTGLDSMEVSFRQAVSHHDGSEMFQMKLITLVDDEEHVVTEWDDPAEPDNGMLSYQVDSEGHGVGADRLYLAWVFEGMSGDIDRWAIDDIALHAFPALAMTPAQYDFGLQQINTGSDSLTVTLENIGGGVVHLHPGDMEITGTGAPHFILHPVDGSVSLEGGESAEIYVMFAPQTTGEHIASLTIHGKNVVLTGECFDPTVTELPWEEDFSALVQGGVPQGWESDTRNWEAFNLNNAGGEPPEMAFWWQPEKTGRFYLITPEIVTEGMDTLALSFKYRIRNFQDPGQYTLGVIAIADGTEHVIREWVDPAFVAPTELLAVVNSQEHGVGSDSFRLAWVFDGITNNIVSWDFDDIHLSEPGDTPVPATDTESLDFGSQTINTTSEPQAVTLQNRGGGTWTINMDNVQVTGHGAADFVVEGLDEPVELGLFEAADIYVAFSPSETGQREAQLLIDGLAVSLQGWGMDAVDYFIYSDFTIVENGVAYTNVGGFREVPGFVPAGSIAATDIHGEGEFGGVVLQLDYDLSFTNDYTIYYMWAYPPVDLSDFDHIVIYIKADTEVSGGKIRMQDIEGFQGVDGEGFAYIDIETEWHRITMPVSDLEVAEWAQNLPNMSEIQKIDLIFEKEVTQPSEGRVYVDMIGFKEGDVSVPGTSAGDKQLFQMYPNPAKERVMVHAKPGCLITLYDISGKVMYKKRTEAATEHIDLSGLREGIYLVSVRARNDIEVQKLIVY